MSLIGYNCILLALTGGAYFSLAKLPPFAGIPIAVLLLLLLMITIFAINQTTAKYADFKSVPIKDTFLEIPNVWKDAVLFTVLLIVLVLVATKCIPFYFNMKNMLGLFLTFVMFWFVVTVVLALQWFLPIQAQLGNKFKKTFKKCFIIFFDNMGFSIFMFFYTLILTAISALTSSLVPGVSGILLSYNNAFRLRLYKYDWLEEHADELKEQGKTRAHIPWGELIADDRETLGPRSFKSFIFPWKD